MNDITEAVSSFATIGEVFEDGVSLIFDGQEEATEKHYRVNTSIVFKAGDRVKILADSGTYVVEYVVGPPKQPVEEVVGVPAGGTKGQALIKGTDDDHDIAWGAPSGITPTGGSTGQVLQKKSNSDHDTQWGNISGTIPAGGTKGQALLKSTDRDHEIEWGTPAGIVPTGGSAGQVLRKSSATNYDIKWETIGVIPSGGTAGQFLKKSSATNYDASWETIGVIPKGGTTGQCLMKSSATDYALTWGDLSVDVKGTLPTGGTSGQVLIKNSSTNYDVKWGASSAEQLTSGIYSLKLSSKVLTPSTTGFSIGTSSYTVQLHVSTIRVYYSSYKYVELACNSNGKLTVGGTAIN